MQLRILVSCSSLLAAIACSPADSTGALLVASAASPIVSTRSATAEQGTIDSLLSAGYDLYPGVLDSASTLWSDALQRSRAIDDSVRIARVLTGLGQAARLSNDLATSRRLGEQALAMKLHLEMREDLFISFNALGLVAWDEQRLGDATDLFEDAAEAAVRTSDSVSLAKAIMNMGLVAKDRGAFSTARMQLEQGGSMAASHNDSRTAVRALNNLAALEITLGVRKKQSACSNVSGCWHLPPQIQSLK